MKVGKVSESVLKRSVLRQIGAERAEAADGAELGKDCAVFAWPERLASCMQEGVLISRAGEKTTPMERLIQKCANNLAAGGFEMTGLMVALILPEETQEEALKSLMRQAGEKCAELGAKIAGGQTRVSGAVTSPVAVVTGYGRPFAEHDFGSLAESVPTETEGPPGSREAEQNGRRAAAETEGPPGSREAEQNGRRAAAETEGPPGSREAERNGRRAAAETEGSPGSREAERNGRRAAAETEEPPGSREAERDGRRAAARMEGAAPGQDVVVSKWIGLEGTARLAERYREKLSARYPARLVEEAACFDRWLSVIPEAAVAVKSGVCAMHDASEGGIFGALWELAERAGVGLTIDLKKLPLRQETVEVCECCNVNPYELLSGGCLVMTAWDGPALAAALAAEGISSAVVGKVTDGRSRMIRNEEEVRYMDRPKQDELYRLS